MKSLLFATTTTPTSSVNLHEHSTTIFHLEDFRSPKNQEFSQLKGILVLLLPSVFIKRKAIFPNS